MGGVTGEIGHQLTRLGNEHGGCLMITSQLHIFGFCVFFFFKSLFKNRTAQNVAIGMFKEDLTY